MIINRIFRNADGLWQVENADRSWDGYELYTTEQEAMNAAKEPNFEPWVVLFYNEIDADFGYDPGEQVYMGGLEPAVAKSIARHMDKVTPDFCSYWAEEESMEY